MFVSMDIVVSKVQIRIQLSLGVDSADRDGFQSLEIHLNLHKSFEIPGTEF